MPGKIRISLLTFSVATSIVNLILFHRPFFEHAVNATAGGMNAVVITGSLILLMLAINFFATYLLLFPLRGAGRAILAVSFILNAVSLYFINTFDVILDDTMMGNVLNTNTAEATGYYSPTFIPYILLLGVLPAGLVFVPSIKYGSFKRFLACTGSALGLMLAIGFGNITNWPWIDNNSTVLGSLILPWSYTVNTIRFKAAEKRNNRQETILPDATFRNRDKKAVVLVIGESARRDHFSLYGYDRKTNPLLETVDGLKAYKADASATYTTAGVKAILDCKDTEELYEILPNYLYRNGADVIWRSSNWGQSPLHIEKEYSKEALASIYPDADPGYDGILVKGLSDAISGSDRDKVLVVLHTSTSHGPSYEKQYPEEFEVFKPVNRSVEMSSAIKSELMNSYDNSIIYTDWLLNEVISQLGTLPDEWESCMIYVSDHGESLGENNLYMHGVPISIAPKEQYEIPFIVWTSGGSKKMKDADSVSQHHVFHSVLGFLDAESPVYDGGMDIFE